MIINNEKLNAIPNCCGNCFHMKVKTIIWKGRVRHSTFCAMGLLDGPSRGWLMDYPGGSNRIPSVWIFDSSLKVKNCFVSMID